MLWNWKLPDWPNFTYDPIAVLPLEKKFLQGVGGNFAVLQHLDDEKKKQFIVEILLSEGLNSSKIEGEILMRNSLQSSIRRHFGLSIDEKKIPLKERKIGELMCKIYDTYDQILTHEMLYEWHRLLMSDESNISDIGKYRTHEEPMQIISRAYDRPIVHFEAPPSKNVLKEMNQFIRWYNDSKNEESILAKASIVHLYFESIHPFEDGNGRIGRALVEKSLSQALGRPTLIAISQEINQKKKQYYDALGQCNNTLKAQNWINFFSEIILSSQEHSMNLINFLMIKSKMMNNLKGKINSRQEKVLIKMLDQGPKGFDGGLSAENYIAITKAPRATATRDLADLVEIGVFYKTGELRYTRYWINTNFSLPNSYNDEKEP
jgi:Fic family protein